MSLLGNTMGKGKNVNKGVGKGVGKTGGKASDNKVWAVTHTAKLHTKILRFWSLSQRGS